MAEASKRLRSYQGADAQADVLGRLAIQRALSAGLTAKEIRTLADKQKLTIKPVGYELLQASKQTGKDIQLSQFQGADAKANILGNYAVQQALQRGLSPQDIRKLARDQNYSFAPKALQTLEAKSGPIRRDQTKRILERAGGDLAKAVDRLSKKDRGLAAGGANLLIRKAGEMPQAGTFGTSGLGQYLQGMAGTAGLTGPRNPQSGYPSYTTPGTPGTGKLGRGTQILPGGKNWGIIPRNVTTQTTMPTIGDTGPAASTAATDIADSATPSGTGGSPYEADINALLEALSGIDTQGTGMQFDPAAFLAQSQAQTNAQMQELFGAFSTELANVQNYFNTMNMQREEDARRRQQAQEAAARTMMINQGRAGVMPDVRIGSYFATPQQYGTQGFKSAGATPTISTQSVNI